jgi:hypothetical protein
MCRRLTQRWTTHTADSCREGGTPTCLLASCTHLCLSRPTNQVRLHSIGRSPYTYLDVSCIAPQPQSLTPPCCPSSNILMCVSCVTAGLLSANTALLVLLTCPICVCSLTKHLWPACCTHLFLSTLPSIPQILILICSTNQPLDPSFGGSSCRVVMATVSTDQHNRSNLSIKWRKGGEVLAVMCTHTVLPWLPLPLVDSAALVARQLCCGQTRAVLWCPGGVTAAHTEHQSASMR